MDRRTEWLLLASDAIESETSVRVFRAARIGGSNHADLALSTAYRRTCQGARRRPARRTGPDPMTTDRNSEGAVTCGICGFHDMNVKWIERPLSIDVLNIASVRMVIAGLRDERYRSSAKVADDLEAAIQRTTPPASIPAAEVLALVERWRQEADDVTDRAWDGRAGIPSSDHNAHRLMTWAGAARQLADELAKLLPRGK